MTEKVIEVKQVSKRYGDKTVLNNVSFAVRKGTIHGFIGPNGAGKTTTLSILTRLVLPTYGEAYIESKSVNRDPRFNERLGFIPAEPKFPARASHPGARRICARSASSLRCAISRPRPFQGRQ